MRDGDQNEQAPLVPANATQVAQPGNVILGAFDHAQNLPHVRGEPSGSLESDAVAMHMRRMAAEFVTHVSRAMSSILPEKHRDRDSEIAIGIMLCVLGSHLVCSATKSPRKTKRLLGEAIKAGLTRFEEE